MDRPEIRKLGTIDCDMVETTPVVWKGRLLRFEYVRHPWYKPNKTSDTYFRSWTLRPASAARHSLRAIISAARMSRRHHVCLRSEAAGRV